MQQTQDDQHHDLGDGASSTEGSSLITKASPADNDGDARASRSTGRGSRETPQRPDVPAANLKRYPLIIVLTAIYVAASTAAWVLLCIMTKRPINGTTYGYEHGYEYEYSDQEQDNQAVFVQNERYLRAVRILQSGVSVFTIPLTSAVCSRAAVVFAQRRLSPAGNSNITLRQTMALADKGWTDPSIIAKLVFGKWRQYGSWFLLFALAMNAFGALISPLQGLFVSYKSVKTPGSLGAIEGIVGFEDNFAHPGDGSGLGLVQSLIRSRLSSTQGSDVQMRLWSTGEALGSNNASSTADAVANRSLTLGNIKGLDDPFWCQLPAGFGTGLLTQYAPRINSTAKWTRIPTDDFPATCGQDLDALYLRYENTTDIGYTAEICMPGNMSETPWKPVRSRQDFTEELYLKVNLTPFYPADSPSIIPAAPPQGVYAARITLDTTAGYFELPNYGNNLKPGPLLTDAPKDSESYVPGRFRRSLSAQEVWDGVGAPEGSPANATYTFVNNVNKGPLNAIALALFGQGSILDIKHTALATYTNATTYEGDWEPECSVMVPLLGLLRDRVSGCFGRLDYVRSEAIKSYLYMFLDPEAAAGTDTVEDPLESAFTAAAFIANDYWFLSTGSEGSFIYYDFGVDRDRPHIPVASMAIISILLSIYLASLLALALYSVAWMPRWTKQLDAFAMIRIGAAMERDDATIWLEGDVDAIKALDEMPGWVGHSRDGRAPGDTVTRLGDVGVLGLGAQKPIQTRRRYRAYMEGKMSRKEKERRFIERRRKEIAMQARQKD